MQPVIAAAWIASGVGVLGVIGTVTVAVSGFRNTQKVTEQTIQAAADANIRTLTAARADRLWERQAAAYAAFMTNARAYRNALRPLAEGQPGLSPGDLDRLAAAIDSAGALVFILLQDLDTYNVCSAIVSAMRSTQTTLHEGSVPISKERAAELNDKMANLLREFQITARNELGVRGIEPAIILSRNQKTSSSPPQV
jgi:hypothetical protein